MGFFARLWLALVCFFRIAFDADFAGKVQKNNVVTMPAPPKPQPVHPPLRRSA